MFRIKFINSNETPIFIQVDPWAGLYVLQKDEKIELGAECEDEQPSFDIYEYGDSRIITLIHSTEYYVLCDGQFIHWTQFPTNVPERGEMGT